MAMAGQREVKRPSHRTVSMWSDLQAALGNIRTVEFALGLLPEKPRGRGIDFEVVQMQLQDARTVLGKLALALSEEADS
ncbi:hypothetical protein ACTU6V_12250 [Microbacterium sp. A204]|uniref:hypothetical protein n=1 Tax=Microbacterium sp. A204 TaxID=3457321 RepID=UPI003FD1FD0E